MKKKFRVGDIVVSKYNGFESLVVHNNIPKTRKRVILVDSYGKTIRRSQAALKKITASESEIISLATKIIFS